MTISLFDGIFGTERASHVAIEFENHAIAYGDLQALTIRTAESLHALNIGKGDRVAILVADSPEFVASFIAIISLGAVAVPINLALRRDEQLFILRDCGARAAVAEFPSAQLLLGDSEAVPDLKDLKDLFVIARNAETVPAQIGGVSARLFN
jgi:long-chain acyl-CoA synthetase